MTLFERIKKWGYEIEYPLNDACKILFNLQYDDPDLYYKYNCHEDGLGIEFSTPEPATSIREFINQIHMVYDDIEGIVDKYDAYVYHGGFNNDETGVHIRIDVSDWTRFERFVFTSFFAKEMEKYRDFVQWVEDHIGRHWYNWNKSADIDYMWGEIFCQRSYCYRSDRKNIRYERECFGVGVYTIETRMFAVEESVDDAIKQPDFVIIMCGLTDKALQRLDRYMGSVEDFDINILYEVWKEEYGEEK